MEKQLIWAYVTPEEKAIFDGKDSNVELQREIIEKLIDKEKKDITNSLKNLDEDVLIYKSSLLKYRQSLKEAQDEHYLKINAFWEEISNQIPSYREKIKEANKGLDEVLQEMTKIVDKTKQVNTELNNIDKWKINDFLETLRKIDSLYGEQKSMFEFLIKNYKNVKV